MTDKRKFWRVFVCRSKGCEFTYRDPLGCLEAWHKCPQRDGKITYLRGTVAA